MSAILIFQFHAPLASFGGVTSGLHRYSERIPARSMLLGMLGAALGMDRENDRMFVQLQSELQFAFRCISIGSDSSIMDFHTIQSLAGNLPERTYTRRELLQQHKLICLPTYREYRCNEYWQVAITQRENGISDAQLLPKLETALKCPKYILYAGRKSCPLGLPPDPQIYSCTLAEAFKKAEERIFDLMTLCCLGDEKERIPAALQKSKNIYWEGDPDISDVHKNHSS